MNSYFEHSKNIKLLPRYGFSFENYLLNIGLIAPNKTDALKENESHNLIDFLEKCHLIFFNAFGLSDCIIRREQKKLEQNTRGDFPIDFYEISYYTEMACYTIVLERMYNGHMGYFEEDVKAVFKYGEKECVLSCYVFIEDKLTFSSKNLITSEFELVYQKIKGLIIQ